MFYVAKDASFKTLFGDQVKNLVKFQENISVGKLPLEIDFILENLNEKTLNDLEEGGFLPLSQVSRYSKIENFIVEYKSKNDKLLVKDLYKVRGYNGLFIEKMWPHYNDENLGTLLILVDLPGNVRKSGKIKKLFEGIYQLELGLRYYLIVINELEIIPENIWFLVFSSGNTLKKLLQSLLSGEIPDEVILISIIAQYDIKEVEEMASEVGYEIPENIRQNRKRIIEIIGKDEVIETIGKDEVIETLGEEELIDALTDDHHLNKISKKKLQEVLQKLKDKLDQ